MFALSLITLLGFAGLALDGGSTFAQKRSQQTAADLAALAAANDYLVNSNPSLAVTARRTVTASNGFTHASGGTTVATDLDTSNGIAITVDHRLAPPQRDGDAAGDADLDGHDHGHGARGLPGHGLRRLAVHLPGRRLRDRRHAEVPDARPTSARPTATCRRADRHRLDELRHRQRRHQRGHGHHRRHDRRSTRRWRSASTSASTTTATTRPCTPGRHATSPAWTCRPRSSTPTATSWAGRRST